MNILNKKLFFGLAVAFVIAGILFLVFTENKNKNKKEEMVIDKTEKTEKPEIVEGLIKNAKDQNVETKALTPKKEEVKIAIEEPLPEGTERFVVQIGATRESISENLFSLGYIKNKDSFLSLINKKEEDVLPGAYKISKGMKDSDLVKILYSKPYMKWVVIKPGLRKEEIAEILSVALNWDKNQKEKWLTKDTTISPEYVEGVYYPDTYLIPVTDTTEMVAKRLISKFNEKFSGYLPLFTKKNIKWARALTLASIVQREASSASDMPLIAGILWNRLNQEIALGVDATLQYQRGNKGNGWWAPISVSEKNIDSPFNTYKNKGLPPHPISNPGVSAIEAVLYPKETECVYYIHDKNKNTHCAKTYEEHIQNIQNYLIN